MLRGYFFGSFETFENIIFWRGMLLYEPGERSRQGNQGTLRGSPAGKSGVWTHMKLVASTTIQCLHCQQRLKYHKSTQAAPLIILKRKLNSLPRSGDLIN